MKALALDLGGSGGKMFAGQFDGKKITMEEVHRFPNQPTEINGHLYWNIAGIYSLLLEGIRKAAPGGFASLGIDSFCNDYGLLDADGKLISQVYTYRDRRTVGIPEIIDQTITPTELYQRTGCQRARFNTLVQLVAQMSQPDCFLLENAASLLFIPDLLNYFLSGEKAAEYTISSVSQVYNRLNAGWDRQIIRRFGLPERIFPTVIPSAIVYGSSRADIFEKTGAQAFGICSVGHHDTASAVCAVPSTEEHFAYISSGTWSLMGTETDGMITNPESLRANFANEGGVGGRNRFLKNIMGLWILQECVRQYESQGIHLTYADLDVAAASETPFRSLFNPDDPEFFEPQDMIGKIQRKCRQWDQPVPETPAQFNRCIKESLALAYRYTLEQIECLTGFSIPIVHVIGGGANSDLLNRMAACAMKRPVHAGPVEAAALGNLGAQFIAAGEIGGLHQARTVFRDSFPTIEYLPTDASAWDDAYARFLKILAI
jgi:rhamnulokinase